MQSSLPVRTAGNEDSARDRCLRESASLALSASAKESRPPRAASGTQPSQVTVMKVDGAGAELKLFRGGHDCMRWKARYSVPFPFSNLPAEGFLSPDT